MNWEMNKWERNAFIAKKYINSNFNVDKMSEGEKKMNTEVIVKYATYRPKCRPRAIYKFNVNDGLIVDLKIIDQELCRYFYNFKTNISYDLRSLSGYIYDEFVKDEKDMEKIFPRCECCINVFNTNMSIRFNDEREKFVGNKDVMRIILNISEALKMNINKSLMTNKNPVSKKERISNAIKELEIAKIISNGDVTIVFWDDNTKTIVRRSVHDVKDGYDLEKAILVSYFQKKTGFSKTLSANVLKELCLMSYCDKEEEKK